MNYSLTQEEECRFNEVVEVMQDKIKLALYKCNISPKNYDEFYSFALEGLLVSFLLVEKGEISRCDFERFCFITMKRKIIDEIRRRNREKIIPIEQVEDLKLFESKDYKIEEIELFSSLQSSFNKEEKVIFQMLVAGKNQKEIFSTMSISKSKGYNIIRNIREKCVSLVYKY